MSRYKVILIKKGIKIGQTVPYGATKEILIKNVSSKVEARKVAKRQVGEHWTILRAVSADVLDPDAR